MLKNKKFKFSAKINLEEVKMTYVGLSPTSKRSTTRSLWGLDSGRDKVCYRALR